MDRLVVDEVRELYESSLFIPPAVPGHNFIICPVGYIGSGKSTVLDLLGKRLSFVRISTDVLRKMLRERGDFDSNHAREIGYQFILKYAEEHRNVAIDANCSRFYKGGDYEASFNEIIKRSTVKVFWIHINPPEEYIIEKLQNYNHTWLFKDGKHAVERYFVRKSEVKKEGIPFIYEFDTSKNDLQEQVDKAADLIKAQLM
jgi:predicted kinase